MATSANFFQDETESEKTIDMKTILLLIQMLKEEFYSTDLIACIENIPQRCLLAHEKLSRTDAARPKNSSSIINNSNNDNIANTQNFHLLLDVCNSFRMEENFCSIRYLNLSVLNLRYDHPEV